MTETRHPSGALGDRVRKLTQDLTALAGEAASADPALRARLDAARRALENASPTERNTAVLGASEDTRAVVRDVLAEELERYWNRRFGGTP